MAFSGIHAHREVAKFHELGAPGRCAFEALKGLVKGQHVDGAYGRLNGRLGLAKCVLLQPTTVPHALFAPSFLDENPPHARRAAFPFW